ncbi:GTP cyclohydrolase 1 type 2 [Parapedobacter defluvii]|uniref:GTP cyclohydrolase 1 type 2 homolog n=1 Tax=Parapedobacter defluvii TaxID=2045106 RepID=A0ABQ1LLQ2_9SPHI|nr:Nif3-like dinuclear metal center hexameric protein [Parapedobacter defluvii]RQP13456.1 MAG: Nif3-like dinuclear metal center hexameric protein [Parapedobacter sp.]GGC25606.1 GTP cyclohydrolase 1 type 2 [Parapedobacter defluvii]
MLVRELTDHLESLAPLAYQESYDNAGLLVGRPDQEINQALISLDCTEAVVDEAIDSGCNVIISHHPIVFKGLKRFNGNSYVERVVMKAIKHDIALYAIHTNLDNVTGGVNGKLAERLGLRQTAILSPKSDLLRKLAVFVPLSHVEAVRTALFTAGAGHVGNYDECSFNVVGYGTFRGGEGTDPYVGNPGEQHREEEVRVEVIFPVNRERAILLALFETHPYEEVAYDIYPLQNTHQQVGSGLIGQLEQPLSEEGFLGLLKERLNAQVIRHTELRSKPVARVAVCGGAGGFLLDQAIRSGADVFVTADYKYHEFFDAEGKIVIADVGHFESEQFTQQLLLEIIRKKFPTFAVRLTGIDTNPIKYYS